MLTHEHLTDHEGRPAGGRTHGEGVEINWQHNGSGATVRDVIDAAMSRLTFVQNSPHASEETALALGYLRDALIVVDSGPIPI